jgi:hypothetical protein
MVIPRGRERSQMGDRSMLSYPLLDDAAFMSILTSFPPCPRPGCPHIDHCPQKPNDTLPAILSLSYREHCKFVCLRAPRRHGRAVFNSPFGDCCASPPRLCLPSSGRHFLAATRGRRRNLIVAFFRADKSIVRLRKKDGFIHLGAPRRRHV